ncbi:G2/mitotic-specific cyclin B [Coccidioides immitis H538.4]|uniref:G2/mitotic-specific cyclin B n=1 Tax=Coccidioides immitis H538.4 TaxID=396776 RepID=A0A0J8RSA9_COCIT|nr:G2/mitotic-specific cyclin B [Coccidioides immitis H538.4]
MPPTRSLRQRAVTNENDENAPTTRLTRAKAAAASSHENQLNAAAAKRPLQSKKSSLNSANTGAQRKRAALGDVSNVNKSEGVETMDAKELKKGTTSRVGLTSKATTQTGGVQKITRSNTSRSALGVRDANKRGAEPKRPGSGFRCHGQCTVEASTESEVPFCK